MGQPTKSVKSRPTFPTISSLMWLVGIVAIACWLSRLDRVDPKTAMWVCVASSSFLLANLYAQSLTARRCPACGEKRVGRLGVSTRSYSYYRCGECGQRLKRGMFGRYWDASGKEDDRHFVPKDRSVKTWDREPIAPDFSSPATRTVSSLLRTKLDRSALVEEAIANGESPLDAIEPEGRAKRRSKPLRSSGVKLRMTEAFFRTMEILRCARSPR